MRQKISTEDYITRIRKIHNDKYDYSSLTYNGMCHKVCIICHKKDENGNEHGEFWQLAQNHLKGQGCPKCSNETLWDKRGRITTENFVKKSNVIHGHKYDYSNTTYIKNNEKVCIICPEHGEFWQTPNSHLNGSGCPKCGDVKSHQLFTKSTNDFIQEAQQIHNNKYDYSKVEYKNNKIKVCIICPEHGEFWQSPVKHLNGQGCPRCNGKIKHTTEDFITNSKKIHNDKYDYSKSKYVNATTKVCIICPEHGEFWQLPYKHLNGCGCIECCGRKQLTTDVFIERSNIVHANTYDYSLVKYINYETPVTIICSKHGAFKQTPDAHLHGSGCPHCKCSIMEKEIAEFLRTHNIKYEQWKTFDWLKYKSSLFLDFYLPDHNVAIECQGIQHFEPVDFAGRGEEWAVAMFNEGICRDEQKKRLCNEHNIKLYYYTNNKNTNSFKNTQVITSKELLLELLRLNI